MLHISRRRSLRTNVEKNKRSKKSIFMKLDKKKEYTNKNQNVLGRNFFLVNFRKKIAVYLLYRLDRELSFDTHFVMNR